MEEEGRVLHHKILQNANQLMEIRVKTIPKKKGFVSKPEKNNNFVRDCLLKKEIEAVRGNLERKTRTENESNNKRGKGGVTVKSSKVSRSRGSSGDSKRKDKAKKHPVLPPNTTWGEFLEAHSTISSVSEQDIVLISSRADGTSSSQDNSNGSRFSNNSGKRTGEWRGSGSSGYSVRRTEAKKDASEGTVSRPMDDRSLQTSAWLNRQSSRYISPKTNTHRTFATQTNTSLTHKHTSAERVAETPETDENHRDWKKGSTTNSTDHLQEQQRTGHTSQSKGSSEGQRIVSDDINASPFGQSALLLLQRLRERLYAQGDSESCEILGLLSTHFNGSGIGNRLEGVSAYPSVFPTPNPQPSKEHKLCLQLQHELASEKKVRMLQEHKIQEMEKLCAKFISYYEKMIKTREEEKKDSQPTNSTPPPPPPADIPQPQVVSQSGEQQEEAPVISSEAESNKGRELKYKLWKIQAERDALEKELRIQHTLTSNLHVQLTRAYKELEQTRSIMSGSVQIIESSAHEVDPHNRHHHSSRSGSCVSSKESEADSAYDERVSSRLTFKHSSAKANLPTMLERTALGTDNIISNSTKSINQSTGSKKSTDQNVGNCVSPSTSTTEQGLGVSVSPSIGTVPGIAVAGSLQPTEVTTSGPPAMYATAISTQATHVTNAVVPQAPHLTLAGRQISHSTTAAKSQTTNMIIEASPQVPNLTTATTTIRLNPPPAGVLTQTTCTNNDWMRGSRSPVMVDSGGLACARTLPHALLDASTIPYDLAYVPQFSQGTLATQNLRSDPSRGNTRQQEVDLRMPKEPTYAAAVSRGKSGNGDQTSTDQEEGQSSSELQYTDRRHRSKIAKDIGRRRHSITLQPKDKSSSHRESYSESADDSEAVALVRDFAAEFSDVDSHPQTLIEKEEFSQISNFNPSIEPLITADSILSDLKPLKNTIMEKQDLSLIPSKLDCTDQNDANTSMLSEQTNQHSCSSSSQGERHKTAHVIESNQEFLPSRVEVPGSNVCLLDLTRTSDTPSSIMYPPHESTRIQAAPHPCTLKVPDLEELKKGNVDDGISPVGGKKTTARDLVNRHLSTVDENTEGTRTLLQPSYSSSSSSHMNE